MGTVPALLASCGFLNMSLPAIQFFLVTSVFVKKGKNAIDKTDLQGNG
jgi:hypothetical protein